MIDLFVEFYRKYKDTKFKHEAGHLYYKPIRTHCEYDWTGSKDWILEECEWCRSMDYLMEVDVNGQPLQVCEGCIEYLNNRRRVLEECEWCASVAYLHEVDVGGADAFLCRACIEYWNKFKGEKYYG